MPTQPNEKQTDTKPARPNIPVPEMGNEKADRSTEPSDRGNRADRPDSLSTGAKRPDDAAKPRHADEEPAADSAERIAKLPH